MTSATGDNKEKETPSGGLTAGGLRSMIREEIVKLLPGKSTKDDGPSTEDGSGTSIKAQVEAALKHLQDKEKREDRDKAVDDMLEKYNQKPEETPPVERRRVEKWMGWGSNDDK